MGECRIPNLTVGRVSTEVGCIQIYGKNADVLKLGDASHEGGDIKIYRDSSANLQLSFDADAASNAIAMSIYGGLVAQNYLTVGQDTLDAGSYNLYVSGGARVTGTAIFDGETSVNLGLKGINSGYGLTGDGNAASLMISIPVTGTDAIDHSVALQIDSNNIIVAQATGDGAGGVTALKARLLHPTYIEAPADADALILGHATQEAGDIKVYRDGLGNLQLSLDADAASNAKALDVYGGVVAQNYLTVGRATLDAGSYNLYVSGGARVTGIAVFDGENHFNLGLKSINSGYGLLGDTNASYIKLDIPVTGTDATNHSVALQIDASNIIVAQATGNGASGITNKAIGLFGVTPQVQQAHIADVAAAAGDPPTKAEFDAFASKFNTLLADLEGYGALASS